MCVEILEAFHRNVVLLHFQLRTNVQCLISCVQYGLWWFYKEILEVVYLGIIYDTCDG